MQAHSHTLAYQFQRRCCSTANPEASTASPATMMIQIVMRLLPPRQRWRIAVAPALRRRCSSSSPINSAFSYVDNNGGSRWLLRDSGGAPPRRRSTAPPPTLTMTEDSSGSGGAPPHRRSTAPPPTSTTMEDCGGFGVTPVSSSTSLINNFSIKNTISSTPEIHPPQSSSQFRGDLARSRL